MYTSGTTGEPKGAVLTHRKTFFNCLNADIFFKLHFDDIMLLILPLFHSGGLFIQASPVLYKGATMIIHPKFDPVKAFKDIERFRVTKFLGVPTIYKGLLNVAPENRGDLSSLKVSAIGGEKTTHALLKQCKDAGFPVRQIMGQTETSILLWASEEASLAKPGTVGRPVFHAEVNLVSGAGVPVKPGEVGEIVVRGSIMMKEYWQDPLKTAETIRNGWLHTGDLARTDEEGYFYLVDRAKDMYISGGENVYPAEVERVLKEHPAAEDVAVVGIPDDRWGEIGHAFVIRKTGVDLKEDDLVHFCEGKLARYKWPKKVTFVSSFPRTSLGKVRKRILTGEDRIMESEMVIAAGEKTC
jgi:fatty-acyl-CoA synthase